MPSGPGNRADRHRVSPFEPAGSQGPTQHVPGLNVGCSRESSPGVAGAQAAHRERSVLESCPCNRLLANTNVFPPSRNTVLHPSPVPALE